MTIKTIFKSVVFKLSKILNDEVLVKVSFPNLIKMVLCFHFIYVDQYIPKGAGAFLGFDSIWDIDQNIRGDIPSQGFLFYILILKYALHKYAETDVNAWPSVCCTYQQETSRGRQSNGPKCGIVQVDCYKYAYKIEPAQQKLQ